jgi:ribosome maturation factor RimP
MKEKILEAIKPIAEKYGQEAADVTVTTNSKGLLVRITVGSKEGPKVSDIISITKDFKKYAAASGSEFLPEDIQIEVSSPGIDRNLKTFQDFYWNEGREIKMIYEEGGGEVTVEGTIVKAGVTDLEISCAGTVSRVPYEKIIKAKLKIKF